MDPSTIIGFALVVLALIAMPGPDWAFILVAGTRGRLVAPAVAGLLVGYGALTLVVAAGVGLLVDRSPVALSVLTLGGAAYLIRLGMKSLRGPAGPHSPDAAPRGQSARWFLVRGAGVSALNPKGLLVFVSILPQFARPDTGWPAPVQLAALGGVFMLLCAAFYLTLGYTAAGMLAARPKMARLTTRVSGLAMIGVGLALLVERLVATLL